MKKIITAICLTLALICCFSSTACKKKKSDLEYVQKKGTLVVGITDYEPMDYKENGQWVGFDAEMATLFANKIGVTVEFVEISWSQKTTELSSKSIDLVWNGMTLSDELKADMDFSVSYATNMQVAVIKKSNAESINSINAVKNSLIAVEEGSAGDTVATETLKASKINRIENQVQSLMEVKAGTSDCAIVDYTMAYSIVGKGSYQDLMIVDTSVVSFNREVFGVGARKKSNLIAKLNEFFKEKYQDGTMKTLAEKYISVALNDEALSSL